MPDNDMPKEVRLPFGHNDLVVRPCNDGYDIFVDDGKTAVKAVKMLHRVRKIAGMRFHQFLSITFDHDGPISQHMVDMPDNIDPVRPTEDGRLFCHRCEVFVENTANAEMRKEGVYAHSHVCQS